MQSEPAAAGAAVGAGAAEAGGAPRHAVLFVDDERNVLRALERLFRGEGYELLTAASGPEGLELLATREVSLVVSDQRMPGMSGAEFLQRVRELYPDTLRIVLTGHADIGTAMAAINEGAVFRFISKPWNDHEIKLVVRDALRQRELVAENRRLLELTLRQNEELRDLNQHLERKVEERTEEIAAKNRELQGLYSTLEKNFFDSIRVFLQLIEMFDPLLGGHAKRVAALSSTVAARLGLDAAEQELVEVAGILHDIGLIGLPRELLTKRPAEMNPSEAALYRQHPVLGHTTLGGIDNLRQVAVLVRTHHENFSGTGFPDRLRGEEIPLGARILHAASSYDELVSRFGFKGPQALEQLRKRGGADFDPEVLFHLQEALAAGPSMRQETVVPLSRLEPGMVLSRNLKTVSGRLLLPERAVVQPAHIEKLQNFNKIDPIDGGIYIFLPEF